MSQVSSDRPRESGKNPTSPSERPDKGSRPGWPEIVVVHVVFNLPTVPALVLAGMGWDHVEKA